jgi:hypothetical protein
MIKQTKYLSEAEISEIIKNDINSLDLNRVFPNYDQVSEQMEKDIKDFAKAIHKERFKELKKGEDKDLSFLPL